MNNSNLRLTKSLFYGKVLITIITNKVFYLNKRNTKQKKLIYNAVMNSPIHPTAEDVYHAVKKQLPNISLTTVYRNLNLQVVHGKIKRIHLPDKQDRFEKNPKKHYHILCEVCGEFEDLKVPAYNFELDDYDCGQDEFLIKSHDIIFRGICPKCKNKNNIKGE